MGRQLASDNLVNAETIYLFFYTWLCVAYFCLDRSLSAFSPISAPTKAPIASQSLTLPQRHVKGSSAKESTFSTAKASTAYTQRVPERRTMVLVECALHSRHS